MVHEGLAEERVMDAVCMAASLCLGLGEGHQAERLCPPARWKLYYIGTHRGVKAKQEGGWEEGEAAGWASLLA